MKAKKYWILAVLVAVIFAVNCWGASENKRKSLVGLEGVQVLVEDLKPLAEKYGLARRSLQTDVELRLRQNGIRVLSEKECVQTPGHPLLYIIVSVSEHSELSGVAATFVRISLKQDVLLKRNPSILCIEASTWESDGFIGLSGLKRLKEIRESVKDEVDEFINDYLAANPKEEKRTVKDEQLIKGTGTIRFSEVEGGFYSIHADSGEEYDPINLPSSYAKDGIRVKFTVRYRPDIVSIHMGGKIVEILKIERQKD